MARRRPYDFKVDAWAAGVVAYMLLAGEPPFADWDAIREGRSPQKDGLLRNIRRGKPDTAIDDLHLSPGAKSLLHNLLHLDPQKRMSCKEAAEHYWVREKGVASHADALASTVVERMQAYGTLGAVRRASIRAAYETVNAGSFDGSTDALVRAVDEAARTACVEHEDECVPWSMDEMDAKKDGEFLFIYIRAIRLTSCFVHRRLVGCVDARAEGSRRGAQPRGVAVAHQAGGRARDGGWGRG